MDIIFKNHENVMKHHVVSVPMDIKIAKVELLTFCGAPAFVGTKLAKLCFDNNKTIILYSKMSGVVNRILVNNDEIVRSGQRIFELRNTNVSRTKSGHKMKPVSIYITKPYGTLYESNKNNQKKPLFLSKFFNKKMFYYKFFIIKPLCQKPNLTQAKSEPRGNKLYFPS